MEKGSPPFTWALHDVPEALQWLTIDPATGVLGGTPAALAPGTTFTVTVTDVIHRSDSKALTLAVTDAPAILTEALPDAVLNASYSTVVAAEGGTPPLAWSLRDLPQALQWLTIDPSTGTLGGTPAVAVEGATFTVVVSGANQMEGSRILTLSVKGPPTIVTTSLPDAFVNSAYSAVVEAEGGTPPFVWSLRDVPRALGWLNIAATSGALGGTPTAVIQPGVTFTVVATDANHLEGSKVLTLAARNCEDGEQIACWVLRGNGDAQCMEGLQTCVSGNMSNCTATATASSSVAHCGPGVGAGTCGTCAPTRSDACVSGQCRCGGADCTGVTQLCCGGSCVDTSSNGLHCGACSRPCDAATTDRCTGGQCRCGTGSACTGGLRCCRGSCADTQNSMATCGSCTTACSSTTADGCANGQCRCGTNPACTGGRTCCRGSCVDTQNNNDGLHCGSCGTNCTPAGTHNVASVTCSGGACQYTCSNRRACATCPLDMPYLHCPGDVGCDSNPLSPGSCGACGNVCQSPYTYCEWSSVNNSYSYRCVIPQPG